MTQPKSGAVEIIPSLAPHLVCAGAAKAIEFYKSAFNAVEMMRMPGQDGKLMHAAIQINGALVMLTDENIEYGNKSPTALNGTPVTLHLTVPDVDKSFAQAVAAGAKIVMPVDDMFWGDRYGIVEDPLGHRWSIATPQKQLSPEELAEAARKAMGG